MKNLFIKVTGDLIIEKESEELALRPDVMDRLLRLYERGSSLTLSPGAGSKITRELDRAGIPYYFGPAGREIESDAGKQIVKNILEDRHVRIQDSLGKVGVRVDVVPCFRYTGSVLWLLNGDLLVKEAYVNYPRLFIFTFEGGRLKRKRKDFRKFPKVEIIGFPE